MGDFISSRRVVLLVTRDSPMVCGNYSPRLVDRILGISWWLYRDNGKDNGIYHIIIGITSVFESLARLTGLLWSSQPVESGCAEHSYRVRVMTAMAQGNSYISRLLL